MSSVGVTGARASVSGKVESLLKDIKEVCLLSCYANYKKIKITILRIILKRVQLFQLMFCVICTCLGEL